MDLRPFLDTALSAAFVARGIHQLYQDKGFTQSTKSTPTDVVTQADKEAEAAIRALIEQRHPGHVVLGEEGGQEGEGEYRWIVDPLDGTVNYAHGFPFYCVSIGLEVRGEVVVGVVLDTARGELFTATKGGGAFHNGRPIQVSQSPKLLGSLVATGFPYDVARDRENLTYLERVLFKGITVRRPGAAALDLAYVACGRLDGFWEVKLNPWDVAAGRLLIEEAGGMVTGIHGEPYHLGNRYLVASNARIHQELLDTIHGRL
ncbi:inositol monophosphatase family protein [Calidithermus roseus]|uniref:Inositol-1-monophosphatase n=1 Tax=Calidithermus roseus TaxID=1644118 RepID=A0A399F4L7_9DEIN|nr:inositol monophosphatase family protein [Calidithermus roseus]RIH89561.1 Inositol-1-monophosphatase [Calidithermus roseus]